MFKFRRLLCAVLVCALVGVAYGAATKIRAFENVAEPGDADGMAIMSYNQGQNYTTNQIILSGLLPNTEYVIVVDEPDGWCRSSGGVKFDDNFVIISAGDSLALQIADNNGHLTLHADAFGGDYSNSDVFVFLLSDWPVPFVVNQEIPVRMIGCNPTSPCGPTCP